MTASAQTNKKSDTWHSVTGHRKSSANKYQKLYNKHAPG